MPTSPLNGVIQHLLADLTPAGDRMTDGELLARYLSSRDDDALAALVRRHAAMVWGVCCRLLHSQHNAEDAFQATFLVLVRKAADVPRQAVANWIYGVARQTAVRLRATATKRGRRETQVLNMPEPTVAEVRDAELSSVLDEVLSRLPDHYRGAIVLCDLEGMTRKEAARQLGIPEGSVASRLARARALLAKRLTQRGVVFSGGSFAGVLSAELAFAAAPPERVATTIKAASLLAAGRAASVISAKVAALTEGTVKAMFVTKIKSVLAGLLVIAALAGSAGLIYQAQAGEQPIAKEEQPAVKTVQRSGEEKQVRPRQQPANADDERILGNWVIVNDDSKRKGEPWLIGKDSILPYPNHDGYRLPIYYRLDASIEPKQIDLSTQLNGPIRFKGVYVLDGDELRLCLGETDKDRPAAFPEKPKSGEVLILHRQKPDAEQPKAKLAPPAKTDRERMVGGWVIVKSDGQRNRKGENWIISKDEIIMNANLSGFRVLWHYHRLDATKTPKQFDIDVKKSNGEFIGLIKGIYAFTDDTELRLCLGDMGKDRPTEFAGKPGQSEFLVLQGGNPAAWHRKAAKDALIDKVLAAHGGEDKLNKLTSFTMTVKHSNGETQHYFVAPPKNFRWETTHRDRAGKRIVILFPEGRRWWTKEPNEDAKEFIPLGLEPLSVDGWFDYVKFFGPRQVLRLKDADHKVTLLDEEIKIGGRTAVGVQVSGPRYDHKMYFDKETHLLVKSFGVNLREVTYSDYKKFDGIPIAQKEKDGYFMPEVTGFRAVEKFDDKLFEKP